MKRKPSPVTVTRPDGAVEIVPASRFRRKRTYKFSLTQAQRRTLFDGGTPRITMPAGKCPFEPGDIYDVPGTKNFSLGIIGVAEGDGTDVLIYRVIDGRSRLLRASVHGLDFDSIRRSYDHTGVPSPLEDAAAVRQAAEESAYTTSPGASLKGEPEAIHKAAEEDVLARKRQKRERLIRSPIAALNQSLSDLEDHPSFVGQGNTIRYLRKRLAGVEQEALRDGGLA